MCQLFEVIGNHRNTGNNLVRYAPRQLTISRMGHLFEHGFARRRAYRICILRARATVLTFGGIAVTWKLYNTHYRA